MQFDTQFLQAPYGFRSYSGFVKGDVHHQCCGCGQRTNWFHMGVLLYFCSEQCYGRFVNQPRVSPSSTAEFDSSGGAALRDVT